MSFINAETKIPALLAAYLETRRSDMSLPSSTVLPIVAAPSFVEFSRPSVTIAVPDFKLPHPKIVEATVEITLHTTRDPIGTAGTTLVNEQQYLAGIRRALSDETSDGFYGYITALTSGDSGWQLRGFKLTGGSTNLDQETRNCERVTTATCWFRSNETTV